MAIAIFNTIVFLSLFMMWKRGTWFNLFLKTLMFCGFLLNGFVALQLAGYLIKV